MGFGGAGPHHSSTASKGVSVAEPPRIGQVFKCLPHWPLFHCLAPSPRTISRSLTPRRGVCGGADTPAPPSAPLAASLRGRRRQRPSQREHGGLHPTEPPTIKCLEPLDPSLWISRFRSFGGPAVRSLLSSSLSQDHHAHALRPLAPCVFLAEKEWPGDFCRTRFLGFVIWISGSRMQGSGFRVQSLMLIMQGSGSRMQSSGFRV